MTLASHNDARTRARKIERVLWLVFVFNLAVAAAKFFYGLASGSAAMQADGIHSVFDSLGNVIGLIGIALASKPADESHPYGHSKFETYGSVAIGVLLILAAFEVGSGAIERLISRQYTADVTVASFVVMIATLVVNISITTYERHQGKTLKSQILSADAAHTLSDVFVSLGVLASLGFVAAGFPIADPLMALIVTVFILISAVSVFRSAFHTLSDHSCIPPEAIKEVADTIPELKEVHNIRTRGTEAEIYCDVHGLVDPSMTVKEAHDLADAFEEEVKRKYPTVKEVLVHIEPYGFEESNDESVTYK